MKTPNWRVVTNRANAQHSTGPKTQEGKAISSRNATRHSLTSKQVVIPGEDPAAYDAHRADLVAALKPANAVESELVEELAANSWRLKRAHRVEAAVLAEIAAGSPDPDMAIAKSFLERPKELDRLVRYMTSIERAYWRVFNKLEAIQRIRRDEEGQEGVELGCTAAVNQSRSMSYESVGFVSQSFENAPAVTAAPPSPAGLAAGERHPQPFQA